MSINDRIMHGPTLHILPVQSLERSAPRPLMLAQNLPGKMMTIGYAQILQVQGIIIVIEGDVEYKSSLRGRF
jgi:hypothetical protein